MEIPTVYQPGYELASKVAPDLARRYISLTTVADPQADAAIASLSGLGQRHWHEFINAGMEQNYAGLRAAPQPLRDLFDELSTPPVWFDPQVMYPGRRAFHRYSDLFIPAFFVSTLRNGATLVAKAFYTTGRVLSPYAHRRIRQNTRHFIEIMLPGSLDRGGDGWKLSVRIRLVHAQVRKLIRDSGEWDETTYGAPISSAHNALASANFSATALRHAEMLGARMNAEERVGFMQAWHYASYLIGTPEELLFQGDEEATHELYRIGRICEPPPGRESIAIANALVRALPDIANMTDPETRARFVQHSYRISRALLGNELADQLEFPKQRTFGVLPATRLRRRAYLASRRLFPRSAERWQGNNFAFLLTSAALLDLSYQLPDRMRNSEATPW